ncbi:hypothetical protein FOL46_006439 [Perkinsus olseni]|uniref:Uncharacterized protein n=1 Tax=Perkinsus olseni TaxID=32597 RepID=A0A7J6LKL5_PEROL|nr:hypothetical protein FOL46_006439 [Perkinsus olseni]
MKEANIDEELRGCLEYQSEELWRYDLMENQWDFIKPLSSVDDSSGEEVGVPHGRYGHSAAMVILDAVVDPDNVRRQYMYIYGGMSMNCLNGLCSDMWRIEVPWAPTAYWPTMTPLSEWRSRRPSRWVRMKDCKYGGRFRHGMEAAPSGDLIFVFGGNVVGKWENSLLVYRTSSDSWEVEETRGYRYFTRSAIDYLGNQQTTVVPDLSKFREDKPEMDTYGPQGTREGTADLGSSNLGSVSEGSYPSQQAVERGDFAMCTVQNPPDDGDDDDDRVALSDLIVIGGFRTYESPYPNENASLNPYPTYPYYLDDLWYYSTSGLLWREVFTAEKRPTPRVRRGAAAVTLRDQTGDAQLLMIGGRHHDDLFEDILNYASTATGDMVVLLGGLTWSKTRIAETDVLRDLDRRCFKQAKDIYSQFCTEDGSSCDLDRAFESIEMQCNTTNSERDGENHVGTFCCEVDTTDLRYAGHFCEREMCVSDCSGHGDCIAGECRCHEFYYGDDCSILIPRARAIQMTPSMAMTVIILSHFLL